MAKSEKDELGREVLRDVSRSFYLTLRALPKGMREATSVGYLLARASDTIADCGGARAERLSLLADFQAQLGGSEKEHFFEAAAVLVNEEGLKEGEKVLMIRLKEVFIWWRALPSAERESVRKVVTTIITGQTWDLERFAEGEVVSLSDASEAEEYCYRVAGCVGEFWTEVGFESDDRFANQPQEELMRLGKDYGKGLQLINILRDEAEDEERGRRYLPGNRSEWMEKARDYLESGLAYSRAVRGRRARLATVLPALIGLETLGLLGKSSPEELAQGVKVGRKVVKKCLWKAIWF